MEQYLTLGDNSADIIAKIKFAEFELVVENLYTYQYDYGKGDVVLRFEIPDTNGDLSYDDIIKPIRDNSNTIDYYINDVLKIRYEGFIKEFKCEYKNKRYYIELVEQSKSERELDILKNALLEANTIIEELSSSIPKEEEVTKKLRSINIIEEKSYIAEFYAMMITNKSITIDDVPERYKEKTKNTLYLLDRNNPLYK